MDKLQEAKKHLDMAKELVTEAGESWDDFLSQGESDKEDMDMMDESMASKEEDLEEEGDISPKKKDLLIMMLKKKKGSA